MVERAFYRRQMADTWQKDTWQTAAVATLTDHGAAGLNFLSSKPLPNVNRFLATISAGSVRLTTSPVVQLRSTLMKPLSSRALASTFFPATVRSGLLHHAGMRSSSGKLLPLPRGLDSDAVALVTVTFIKTTSENG